MGIVSSVSQPVTPPRPPIVDSSTVERQGAVSNAECHSAKLDDGTPIEVCTEASITVIK